MIAAVAFKAFKVALTIAVLGLAIGLVEILAGGPQPKEGASDLITAFAE